MAVVLAEAGGEGGHAVESEDDLTIRGQVADQQVAGGKALDFLVPVAGLLDNGGKRNGRGGLIGPLPSLIGNVRGLRGIEGLIVEFAGDRGLGGDGLIRRVKLRAGGCEIMGRAGGCVHGRRLVGLGRGT